MHPCRALLGHARSQRHGQEQRHRAFAGAGEEAAQHRVQELAFACGGVYVLKLNGGLCCHKFALSRGQCSPSAGHMFVRGAEVCMQFKVLGRQGRAQAWAHRYPFVGAMPSFLTRHA